jgi:hypothetical protein
METVTLNELRINPELIGILHVRARRARAQAIHNGVLQLATAIGDWLVGRGPLRLPRSAPRQPLRAHWG